MERLVARSKEDNIQKHLLWLDALRVLSMIAVVTLHITATGYKGAEQGSYEWTICYTLCLLTRFAVPIFVMISGALFLSPEKQLTTGDIWRKYVKRLMVVFLFWSAIYASFETLKTYSLSDHRYYLSFIKRFFEGHYHMWYIYMIVFLYIITPFLRRIAEDKRLLQLFLLYAFLFGSCTELLCLIPYIGDTVSSIVHDLHCDIISGYVGYYCLGYYLVQYGISKKAATFTHTITVIATALLIIVVFFQRNRTFEFESIQSETLPFAVFMSISIFAVFEKVKDKIERSNILSSVVRAVSPLTLGIYVIHPAINIVLRELGLHALSFNPVIGVPLCVILVVLISGFVTWIIRKVPTIKIV